MHTAPDQAGVLHRYHSALGAWDTLCCSATCAKAATSQLALFASHSPHDQGCVGGAAEGSSGGPTHAPLHLPPGWRIFAYEHHSLSPIDETLLRLRADVARAGPAMAWHPGVLAGVVLPGEYGIVATGCTLTMAELQADQRLFVWIRLSRAHFQTSAELKLSTPCRIDRRRRTRLSRPGYG